MEWLQPARRERGRVRDGPAKCEHGHVRRHGRRRARRRERAAHALEQCVYAVQRMLRVRAHDGDGAVARGRERVRPSGRACWRVEGPRLRRGGEHDDGVVHRRGEEQCGDLGRVSRGDDGRPDRGRAHVGEVPPQLGRSKRGGAVGASGDCDRVPRGHRRYDRGERKEGAHLHFRCCRRPWTARGFRTSEVRTTLLEGPMADTESPPRAVATGSEDSRRIKVFCRIRPSANVRSRRFSPAVVGATTASTRLPSPIRRCTPAIRPRVCRRVAR